MNGLRRSKREWNYDKTQSLAGNRPEVHTDDHTDGKPLAYITLPELRASGIKKLQ